LDKPIPENNHLLSGRESLKRFPLVIGVGLAVGLLSLAAQATLPYPWSQLGNSGAVWLFPAFLIGRRMPTFKQAALAGFATLLGALAGFFVAGTLLGVPYSWAYIGYWAGVALVGGPLFGAAGLWARDERRYRRVAALALMGGVFLAEAVHDLTHAITPPFAAALCVAAVLIPLALSRSWRERLYSLLSLVPTTLLGLAAYQFIDWLTLHL
jgi:hypothetical protein